MLLRNIFLSLFKHFISSNFPRFSFSRSRLSFSLSSLSFSLSQSLPYLSLSISLLQFPPSLPTPLSLPISLPLSSSLFLPIALFPFFLSLSPISTHPICNIPTHAWCDMTKQNFMYELAPSSISWNPALIT